MAVLLECARCYQHYTVPKQALRKPTSCPWCGASSADSSGTDQHDGATRRRKLSKRSKPASASVHYGKGRASAQSNGQHRADDAVSILPASASTGDPPAVLGFPSIGGSLASSDGGPSANQMSPGGINGIRTVQDPPSSLEPVSAKCATAPETSDHRDLRRLPPLRRAITNGSPPSGPPLVEPPIAAGVQPCPSRSVSGPRYRAAIHRRSPPLLWLVIGIGLGACVVLSVLTIMLRSERADRDHDSSRSAQKGHTKPNLAVDDRHRQNEGQPTSERSNINRRESQGVGSKVIERKPPGDRDADAGPTSAPTAMRVKDDDSSAILELVAAKIGFHKAEAGHIDLVDGSFRMTDSLMAHVAKLPNLVQLKLSLSNVTDAGLAHIANLTGLKELLLNETKVTNAAMAHLEKLTNLEKLDLEKTGVSDECIAQLKKLTRLNHLDLRGTRITAEGIRSLKEALPDAKIRAR